MKKVILCILILCLTVLPLNSSVKAVEDRTVFYLDYGDVKIGSDGVSGYDENGKLVSEVNAVGYTVTQQNPQKALERSISITSGEQNVEIKNINIARKGENDYALCVLKTASAVITVNGENHLKSGTYRAGLDIAVKASAVINGDGILYAESELEAGIGGGSGKSNGTLIINSGTIYATGGTDGYSAGIGGGSSGKGGTITINGGTVVAVGGLYAAGIGGGFLCSGGTVTINGGTVTAIGGNEGAGIGGGSGGNGGTVVINGGSVKAIAGTGADDIGNGNNCKTEFAGIHNSNGDSVSKLTVSLSGFERVYQNSIENAPITAGHPDDENLYFYVTSSQNIATVYMNGGEVKYLSYNSSGFDEINPFLKGDERYSSYLIVSDKNNISVADGFFIEKENCRLIYNGSCVDKFEIVIRGDVNLDGNLDGMDAVEAACVEGGMNTDKLALMLADANGDGYVNTSDISLLENLGIASKN